MDNAVPLPREITIFLDLVTFDLLAVEVEPGFLRFSPLRGLLRGVLLLPAAPSGTR